MTLFIIRKEITMFFNNCKKIFSWGGSFSEKIAIELEICGFFDFLSLTLKTFAGNKNNSFALRYQLALKNILLKSNLTIKCIILKVSRCLSI